MNIQLRDSKPLQEAIRKRFASHDRPNPLLAAAQLHPELISGIIDASPEGFTIRSEHFTGDLRGNPNPQDMANLQAFLAAPAECEAKWKVITLKQGESMVNIPSELRFNFPTLIFEGKIPYIAIHTQAVGDVTKLTSALPSDQSARFTATPSANGIGFKRVGAPLPQPVIGPTIIANLKTQAAILGVAWDNAASVETMVERIDAAIAAKAKAKPAKGEAKGEKKDLQPA